MPHIRWLTITPPTLPPSLCHDPLIACDTRQVRYRNDNGKRRWHRCGETHGQRTPRLSRRRGTSDSSEGSQGLLGSKRNSSKIADPRHLKRRKATGRRRPASRRLQLLHHVPMQERYLPRQEEQVQGLLRNTLLRRIPHLLQYVSTCHRNMPRTIGALPDDRPDAFHVRNGNDDVNHEINRRRCYGAG